MRLARLTDRLSRFLVGRRRRMVAARFLRGCGIEIGALDQPLVLPRGATAIYVDRCTKNQLAERFPDLDRDRLLAPQIVGDGFELAEVEDRSQDFVAANHVLEHAADPVGVMQRWWQVLRHGGVMFLTVPLVDRCFDRGRALTSVQHLLDDHEAASTAGPEALRARCAEHYLELVAISERNMARQPRLARTPDVEQRAGELAAAAAEIHFHTFSTASCLALTRMFCARASTPSRLLHVAMLRNEAVMVLARSD